jgi:pyruvate kinase
MPRPSPHLQIVVILLFRYLHGGHPPHILVFTSNERILTQLNLLWGVKAFYYDRFVSTDETIEDVNAIACKKGYLDVGDMLISLSGHANSKIEEW